MQRSEIFFFNCPHNHFRMHPLTIAVRNKYGKIESRGCTRTGENTQWGVLSDGAKEQGFFFFNFCLNMHVPLHSSNTTFFMVHFGYWECSDYVGQWIPFTGVIYTSLPTCTYKGNICICYNRSKFMDFKNSKNGFWCLEIIYCLLAGQVPNFMTLCLNISLCLVSRTDTVNGLRFDHRR
jgi:hypothetical protein